VTRNYSEKSINSILDYISTSQQVNEPSGCLFSKMFSFVAQYTLDPVCYVIALSPLSLILPPPLPPFLPSLFSISPLLPPLPPQSELLQWFYETTLEALQDARNDRLWFKTNTKVKISHICCCCCSY